MISVLSALAVMVATTAFYQLGGYAKASDLEKAEKECKARHVEARVEMDSVRKDVVEIKESIVGIDAKLGILLDGYREKGKGK